MGVASGLVAQVGFGAESTPGTRVVPTAFFEFTSESLKSNRTNIVSKGLRAGRVLGPLRWGRGKQDVTGSVTFEVAPQGLGYLLKRFVGPNTTTGAGPYVHTFLGGGVLDYVTSTIQVGRPSTDGTVRPFDYSGCAFTGWSMDAQVDQYLMGSVDVYGMSEVTNQTLATAAYPATITPFTFLQGSVTIAGSAQDVKSFSLKGDNGLVTGRHQIRATTPDQPKPAIQGGRRSITGTLTADFTDLTLYNRFVNATESALVLSFVSGASSLVITGNIRPDGETPSVGGPDLLEVSMPFEFVSSTSDGAAFTAVLTSTDVTVV